MSSCHFLQELIFHKFLVFGNGFACDRVDHAICYLLHIYHWGDGKFLLLEFIWHTPIWCIIITLFNDLYYIFSFQIGCTWWSLILQVCQLSWLYCDLLLTLWGLIFVLWNNWYVICSWNFVCLIFFYDGIILWCCHDFLIHPLFFLFIHLFCYRWYWCISPCFVVYMRFIFLISWGSVRLTNDERIFGLWGSSAVSSFGSGIPVRMLVSAFMVLMCIIFPPCSNFSISLNV